MSAKIIQINVKAEGGVPKLPVEKTRLTSERVEGDKQNDLRYHGGPSRAVCLYSAERIEELRAEGHPIEGGWTGENLLLSGLDWEAMVPGVQLQIGAARVEITSYANPCKFIGYAFLEHDFNRIGQKKHPGWSRLYARVLTESEIKVGDEVSVMKSD